MTAAIYVYGWMRLHGLRRSMESSERGANLIEYTLLIALVVLMALAAVTQFGKKVPAESFTSVASSI